MSLVDRVEFLCRLGSFTTTTEPTLDQVNEQLAVEYAKLDEELTRKGYEIESYPYETAEIIVYKVAAEILLGNSRNNDTINALGKEYMETYKELKKDLFKSLALIGSYYTEGDISESDYPDWIDDEEEW